MLVSRFLFLSSCFAIAIVACTDTDQPMNNNPCGDGVCDDGETHATCPADCLGSGSGSDPDGPTCGNGKCETGETQASCPQDCGSAAVCGNNKCETGETVSSCPADCEAMITVENDSSYDVYGLYAWPCGSDDVGPNILSGTLVPGYEITIDGPIGCFDYGATDSTTIYWESDNNEVSNSTYTWELTNTNYE
jgi:hypothetical protein